MNVLCTFNLRPVPTVPSIYVLCLFMLFFIVVNTIINFRNSIRKAVIIIVANIANLVIFVAVNFKNVITIVFIIRKIISFCGQRYLEDYYSFYEEYYNYYYCYCRPRNAIKIIGIVIINFIIIVDIIVLISLLLVVVAC